MTNQELKSSINEIKESMESLKDALKPERVEHDIKTLEKKTMSPDFWSDQNRAQTIIADLNELKQQKEGYDDIAEQIETLELTHELRKEDDSMDLDEAKSMIPKVKEDIHKLWIKTLLGEPYDKLNAILEFHPGAGGTESQDWASMLLRMYTRYAESKGYSVRMLDYLDGDEAGLKSATLLIKGKYAYGYLKAEAGVHRLVRISPFDSSGRRHTSFASVNVVPELDDSINVEIDESDLKIDTYRSSGKGGQGVNTTDSAVRITHLPTNLVVTCQNERSQIQNKATALNILKGKLYQLEMQKKKEQMDAMSNAGVANAWGSQIRSYVFHPYTMVKDHRTQVETGNTDKVMDGDLDPFIEAYLSRQEEE